MRNKLKKQKRKPGRPSKRIPEIDATPEEIARRIFANNQPPDPSSLQTRPFVSGTAMSEDGATFLDILIPILALLAGAGIVALWNSRGT